VKLFQFCKKLKQKKMRYLLFLLILLPSVVFAGDRDFTYRGVSIIESGGDNFRLSQYSREDKTGDICLKNHVIKINNKQYKLKRTGKDNIYRVKGGMVQFVYENHQLASIRLCQYNQVIRFRIENENTFALLSE
jgi:hypothetical protein